MAGSDTPPDASSTVVLPSSPQSSGLARAAIRGVCVAAHLTEEVSDTASLLTSELVTHARQNDGRAVMMDAAVRGAELHVSVSGGGRGRSTSSMSSAVGGRDHQGRSLLLVSSLATRWGTRPRAPHGKALWFELEPVR